MGTIGLALPWKARISFTLRERGTRVEPSEQFAGGLSPAAVDGLSEDAALAAACRSGDLRAYERLCALHGARMKNLARNVLGNAVDAEEAVQDTFLKVQRGIASFRGQSTFVTWTYRILINTCYDARRNELRDYSDSLSFWPRIERALAEDAVRNAHRAERKSWFSLLLPGFTLVWQTALAGAFVLVLTISAGWLYLHRSVTPAENDTSFLKSGALKEVESAEAAYERAIDKLAVQAQPQLENPATPLLANYHEKLLVLDSAIAELRAQTGMNPSNAQLRYQLLAMYQEKQQTLEEVLEAKPQ